VTLVEVIVGCRTCVCRPSIPRLVQNCSRYDRPEWLLFRFTVDAVILENDMRYADALLSCRVWACPGQPYAIPILRLANTGSKARFMVFQDACGSDKILDQHGRLLAACLRLLDYE
jgi:hypothetical protein